MEQIEKAELSHSGHNQGHIACNLNRLSGYLNEGQFLLRYFLPLPQNLWVNRRILGLFKYHFC